VAIFDEDDWSQLAKEEANDKNRGREAGEISQADEIRIQAWQQEFGISDEMLAYFVTNYPGIEQSHIEDLKKGKLKETELPKLLYPDGKIPPHVPFDLVGDGATEEEREVAGDLIKGIAGRTKENREVELLGKRVATDPELEQMFLSGLSEEERIEFESLMKDEGMKDVFEGLSSFNSWDGVDKELDDLEKSLDLDDVDEGERDFMGREFDQEFERELGRLARILEREKGSSDTGRHDVEKMVGQMGLSSDDKEATADQESSSQDDDDDDESGNVDSIVAELENELESDSNRSAAYRAKWHKELDEVTDVVRDAITDNRKEREKPGFWNYESDEGLGEDEVFQSDDISSMGHGELELHREIREYSRYAAWEMPLLSKLAKPFDLPSPSQPLRFRYTTYMGEQHPAARKVVLEFAPKDLKEPAGLDDAQITKLIKLCSVRYNPETQIVKMSCESFETQAQNKRYLGDLVDKLVKEAKDTTDMFEDVPIDRRHVKKKPFFHFPEQWKLTPERRKELEERRRLRLETEKRRQIEGGVVDGLDIIQQALAAKQANMQPVVVGAGTNVRRRLA
jgi:small subunit ribosomal protein S35